MVCLGYYTLGEYISDVGCLSLQCYTVAMNFNSPEGILIIIGLLVLAVGSVLTGFYTLRTNRKYHSGSPLLPGTKHNWLEALLIGKDCVQLHFLLSNAFYDQAWVENEIDRLRENNRYAEPRGSKLLYIAPLLALALDGKWTDVDELLSSHQAVLEADEAISREDREDGSPNQQIEQLTAARRQQVTLVQNAAATRDIEQFRKCLNIDSHDKDAGRKALITGFTFMLMPIPVALFTVFYFLFVFIPA